MKVFIVNFVGFQFDDDEDYHQNGSFIVKADDKNDAVNKLLAWMVSRLPNYSVIMERNFDEVNEIWGGPNENVDVTEISVDEEIIAYDFGGY